MAQIIEKKLDPTIQALGTGLGSGLQSLMNMKMQEMQQRKKGSAFRAMGFPDELAQNLGNLDPKVQQMIVQELLPTFAGNLGRSKAGQGQYFDDQISESDQPGQGLEEQMRSLGTFNYNPMDQAVRNMISGQNQPVIDQGESIGIQPDTVKAGSQVPKIPSEINRPQLMTRSESLAQAQRQKDARKENAEAFRQTAVYRKEVLEKGRAAKNTLQDLNRLQELNEKGDLDTPGYIEFLSRAGLDIQALKNPDTQEFEKIANSFIKDAKQYFGARVSNFELDAFLKTIPSLSQTPEGRNRVLANLKRISKAGVIQSQAMRKIMAKNKNLLPLDLMERVEDKVDKKTNSLAEQFREDLKREVPEAPSKFHTALGGVLGGILSAPGKLLGKVGGIGAGAEMIPPI